MAWAEKRSSGKWQGVYRVADGKRRSAGVFTHKPQAVRAASKFEAEARAAGWRDPQSGEITFREWVEKWWPTRNVVASTLRADASRRDHRLLPRWGDVPLIDITRQDVRAWAADLANDELTPASVQRHVALLSSAMSAAVDAEIIGTNPTLRMRLPSSPPANERYLGRAEYGAIRGKLEPPDQFVADLLVSTGMRWGEAAGLHTHRVQGELLRVVEVLDDKHRVIRAIPKDKQVRDVPLPADLAEHIAGLEVPKTCGVKHETGKCRAGLVLTTARGYALDYSRWARKWRSACQHAGFEPCGIHTLRHTYASWLAEDGHTMSEIALLLGHSSVTVTERYAHIRPPDRSRVVASVDWRRGAKRGARSDTDAEAPGSIDG